MSGLFTVHFFVSVQMVTVSKNHGYKWFAVIVFKLSRLEHGWLRKNSVCCGVRFIRSMIKSAVWLRCGLRFQVKPAGRFRSGLHSASFVPNCDISHAFSFRHAFTATNKLFYISTSTVSPAVASCADCTSWRHWLRLSCCAAMTALYF